MRSPAEFGTSPQSGTPGNDSGQETADTQLPGAAVDLDRDHASRDDRNEVAPVNNLPPAGGAPMSNGGSPGADHLGTDQATHEGHTFCVGADLNGDQGEYDDQNSIVAESGGNGHICGGTQPAAAEPSDALLLILADRLNDLEGLRKATSNQLSALTRSAEVSGGKGLSEHSKAAVSMADWLALLEQEEHKVVLQLRRALRQHPLGDWVKRTRGLADGKAAARLIAAIGDPYWNSAEDRPRRGPAELWAYCGYAPGQKRQKGVQSNWNAEAKMRAFLCAEACQTAGVRKSDGCDDTDGYDIEKRTALSPYGQRYLDARASWASRDTSDAHKHQHALRCVAKGILKDLFLEAKRTRGFP